MDDNMGSSATDHPATQATITAGERAEWEGGKCRVPMWCQGVPAGFCDEPAFGPQYPEEALQALRGWYDRAPYCNGPCCPKHGGPKKGEVIIFQDGLTEQGRPMWCAVMPGFINLQESPSGFSGNPMRAVANLVDDMNRDPAVVSPDLGPLSNADETKVK